jgi:ribosomal protein L11 methyltransferase
MSSPDLLHVLHITVPPELEAPMEAAFAQIDIAVSRWEATDDHEVRFDIFFEDAAEAARFEAILRDLLGKLSGNSPWTIVVTPIPNEDWQESWKAYFHVERVSERIVTKPSWEPYAPTPTDCVIEIDPGMSFGTGQHATTRGCLRFLDTLANTPQAKSFLDLGCGSGILSIAAAKLGYGPIVAIDIDPDAIRVSKENFDHNDVSDQIDVATGDVSALAVEHPYSVVAANILAPVLLGNAESIASTVARPQGHLLLAGILTEQYDEVRDAYTALGFEEIDRATEAEWTSGCFRAH